MAQNIVYDSNQEKYVLNVDKLDKFMSMCMNILIDRKNLLNEKIMHTINSWNSYQVLLISPIANKIYTHLKVKDLLNQGFRVVY